MNETQNNPRLLHEALAKAQAEIRDAKANKKNAFIGSKYADLSAVWDAIREPLTAHGLSITQTFEPDGENILLSTSLRHDSGESITSVLPLLGVKDWHSLGSAITYARRYSLAALVGCAPEGDDDDGNRAQGNPTQAPTRRSKSIPRRGPRKDGAHGKALALEIIGEVSEANEWLRNKEVDPGDPPKAVIERILTLGKDGLKKTIADDRKKQAKAEAKEKAEEEAAAIVAKADKVEPVEDKDKEAKQ